MAHMWATTSAAHSAGRGGSEHAFELQLYTWYLTDVSDLLTDDFEVLPGEVEGSPVAL